MIINKKGNIFTTKAQTIVNTINCVGFMGKGIAYEFRLRHSEMFNRYKELCSQEKIKIGTLWIYPLEDKKILNFPTKNDYKEYSKISYLEKGLKKFIDTYKEKNIKSIAFPILGSQNGGLSKEESLKIMEFYLSKCDIDVEIWEYDPMAKDDVYEYFKEKFLNSNNEDIKEGSGLRLDYIKKIKEALKREDICTMSGLLEVKGIGDISLEKSFNFIKNYKKNLFELD